MIQDEIKAECKALAELLCRKNTDYGDAAEKSPVLLPFLPPRTAIFVRMSDKIERMKKLLTSQACVGSCEETFQDTVRDLAGYCVLLLITDKKTLASMNDEKETNLDQTKNG